MEENMGFFKRIKTAIFKLENYGVFLGERCSKAFKFFFLLILLSSLAVSLIASYDFYKMMDKAYSYIESEMPGFTYENEKLTSSENLEAYDKTYEFRLFINTEENVDEETIKTYKTKIYDDNGGIILLKDKVIYLYGGQESEETYSKLFESYGIDVKNKEELVQTIHEFGKSSAVTAYVITNFSILAISDIITNLSYLFLVAFFGYIAARICGVRFKIAPMLSLSVYSLTLPIVLGCIYNSQFIITGFVIKYFNVMYLLIAYVYIIAAILMIKYDLIKQSEELQKIIEVQKQVKNELDEEKNNEEPKEKEEKNKKEDKEEDNTPVINEENKEPDGSEI